MRVLIVDDEVFAVNALVNRIDWNAYGFDSPLAAYSLAQAQPIFLAKSIDLILCDIEMPQGSGLELFEWIKLYYPLTECIFVTCHDEYEYLRHAMQLGSCDYILKPVDYDELRVTVKGVVERISARETHRQVKVSANHLSANINTNNQHIAEAVAYIMEHLTEPIAITDIADALYLNPQYVMRLFKKELGCSILQYITARRIALAIQYLEETQTPVTEIALQSGFDNYSYFTRVFKRFTNETPTKYRKLRGS